MCVCAEAVGMRIRIRVSESGQGYSAAKVVLKNINLFFLQKELFRTFKMAYKGKLPSPISYS